MVAKGTASYNTLYQVTDLYVNSSDDGASVGPKNHVSTEFPLRGRRVNLPLEILRLFQIVLEDSQILVKYAITHSNRRLT